MTNYFSGKLIATLSAGLILTACSGDKEKSSTSTRSPKRVEQTNTPAPKPKPKQKLVAEPVPTTQPPDPVKPVAVAAVKSPEELGAKVFKKCKSCHTTEKDGRNGVGPNLYGIVGAPSATVEGYKYSAAMKDSGIVWTEDQLMAYLKSPKGVVPKTKMAFVGLKKDADLENIIAYLNTLSDDPEQQ